jgi:hypothetical protein
LLLAGMLGMCTPSGSEVRARGVRGWPLLLRSELPAGSLTAIASRFVEVCALGALGYR